MDRRVYCGLDGAKSVAAPMRVNLRLRRLRRGLVPEGPMKVARHFSAGEWCKNGFRPARDDRNVDVSRFDATSWAQNGDRECIVSSDGQI
jgi:hypothetical protein